MWRTRRMGRKRQEEEKTPKDHQQLQLQFLQIESLVEKVTNLGEGRKRGKKES
jgi:hypothetical protein